MKRLAIIIALVAPVLATPAFAQDAPAEGEVATRFYDFNDMLIDGELQRPEGMFATERGRARFQSLLNLRRSFINEVEEAAHEGALQ